MLVNFTNFKDTAIFIHFNDFSTFCSCLALQHSNSHYTVQNYQQDWNDILIEGTIMLITLPENKNTVKTIVTVHSLKKGKGEEECVEQPAIPVLKRGR